ncbi:TetR family transcriptional regulator [Kribbella speibonae]|uniref:TetR/AcrR family transcriptional regulator n=1 Tax=Kribbella speibonae TaxID=1572660 RepID=A0A4R0J2J8_9ACTN|nr:TetR family transcriptional regulator [Kribbella speibonae]TCC15757.1 TetR/AcrR family transcriptional regulator [Kribbella speibonae]TCC40671.1 TetR/AcrR family transcriptional regulator [Kribbella speibonae]
MTDSATAKGEQTRELILSTALRLFREQGYGKTTMRAIANEAGVSVGNAYYYYGSKDHLMQAYYDLLQDQHREAVEPILATEKTFVPRMTGVLRTWLDVAAPYHEFAGTFFKTAADPRSPLSPFSEESRPARDASVDVFRRVIDGSDLKLAADLKAELPELLWLLQMGVVLFWVHDQSEDVRRSRALIDRAVPLVDRLLRLTRIPGVRGVTTDIVGLINSIKP